MMVYYGGPMNNGIAYAVDFGTSNSLLAATHDGKAIPPLALDPTNEDPTVMRSLMYFPKTGEPVPLGAKYAPHFKPGKDLKEQVKDKVGT